MHVKHIKQSLRDFQNDTHRFSFIYSGKKETASCIGSCSVFFDSPDIPENIQDEVMSRIWKLMDEKESTWAAPKGALAIADAYCTEEFA